VSALLCPNYIQVGGIGQVEERVWLEDGRRSWAVERFRSDGVGYGVEGVGEVGRRNGTNILNFQK